MSKYLFVNVVVMMMIVLSLKVESAKVGQYIPMQTSVQYNSMRTDFKDMEMKLNPRFAMPKTVEINGAVSLLKKFTPEPLQEQELASIFASSAESEDETVKIMFALDLVDFRTPWITVIKTSESNVHILTRVDFIFEHMGPMLLKVKYNAHYADESDFGLSKDDTIRQNLAKIPETIKLVYHWEQVAERDTTTGITFIYFMTFVTGIAVISVIMYDGIKMTSQIY